MLFLSDVLQIKNKQLYIEVGFCVICFAVHLHTNVCCKKCVCKFTLTF